MTPPADGNENVLRTFLGDSGYLTMVWPKDATLADLEHGKEVVNLQLDHFIRYAQRKKVESRDAALMEYESWFPVREQPESDQQMKKAPV